MIFCGATICPTVSAWPGRAGSRQGSPYILVLHKTEALFTSELQARKRDETDLGWLATQWSPDA